MKEKMTDTQFRTLLFALEANGLNREKVPTHRRMCLDLALYGLLCLELSPEQEQEWNQAGGAMAVLRVKHLSREEETNENDDD